ncbi:hypothetical protein ACWIG5_14740 [Streptomyces lydicus]
MSHSQQPAPFGQQPLLYAIPYVPPPSVPPPSVPPSSSAQPPKSPHSALRIAVGVACALLVLGLAAVVGNGGDATKNARTKPAPTVTGAVTANPAETANPAKTAKAEWERPKRAAKDAEKASAPAGPATALGQGSYLVGEDIAAGTYGTAGTYRTAGPAPSDTPLCSWARSRGADGEPAGIVARGTSRGPARVTVNQGETFETHGCKEWTRVR